MTAGGGTPAPSRPDRRDERVSAVIPTIGRPSLLRAVRSVLAQTVPVDKIIVSVDGPAECVTGLPDDSRIEVIASGRRQGANAARVAGMDRAGGGLIALLDDDDVWAPRKVELQLDAYRRAVRDGAKHIVVGALCWLVRPDGSVARRSPDRLLRPGESIASYLFDRRSIRRNDGYLGPPVLLFDHDLLAEIPFDTSLIYHEDWDWLLRVDAARAAEFVMVPEQLSGCTVNEYGRSASSANTWPISEHWVLMRSDLLSARQQAEVLLTCTAPLAMQQGDWIGAARLMATAAKLRPGYRSWLFSLAHVPLVISRRTKVRFRSARARPAPGGG